MRISKHVYAKKMYFIAKTPGGEMTRTVYVYFVTGSDSSCLIDTGVYPGISDVLAFLSECGAEAKNIGEILLTHAHTDHIGALPSLKRMLNCTAAASAMSSRWIEDASLQRKERPVPNYDAFVEGSTQVERIIADGDITQLGGSTLMAYGIPGHEPGQMAYFHREDGVLFSADCLPVIGEIPIYNDVRAEIASIQRLSQIEGVKTLLMSWDDPYVGEGNIQKAFADALDYVKRVHELTLLGMEKRGEGSAEDVAQYVHGELGLPAGSFMPFFVETIQAHMREKGFIFQI